MSIKPQISSLQPNSIITFDHYIYIPRGWLGLLRRVGMESDRPDRPEPHPL